MATSTNKRNGACAEPASGRPGGTLALAALFAGLIALISIPNLL